MNDDDLTLWKRDGHNGYLVRILAYMLGQHRIQLIDTKRPELGGPGAIVREMCSYDRQRAESVAAALANADDPEALAERYVQPWNCEGKGGRIRLDNKDGHR